MLSKIFLILFILTVATMTASAETIIPEGNVSGTWTASGSPYLVEGEITIANGALLTVEPGVDVIFQGHYKFIVNGMLEAVGTENDSICITAADTSDGWHGLRFYDLNLQPDSSRLVYCEITYGRSSSDSAAGDDKNGGAVFCSNSSILRIQYCTIRDNRTGDVEGVTGIPGGTGESTVSGHGGAIYCTGSSPFILNNSICYNRTGNATGGNGGDGDPGGTGGSAESGCGGAIYCVEGSPFIDGNSIFSNSTGTATGGPGGDGELLVMWGHGGAGGSAISGGGGAGFLNNSDATLSNNLVYDNSTGDGIGGQGGVGVFDEGSNPAIGGSGGSAGSGTGGGGGAINLNNSDALLFNNSCFDNFCGNGIGGDGGNGGNALGGSFGTYGGHGGDGGDGFGGQGGVLELADSDAQLSNNMLFNNVGGSGSGGQGGHGGDAWTFPSSWGGDGGDGGDGVGGDGGAVYLSNSNSQFSNFTFSQNDCGMGTGGYGGWGGQGQVSGSTGDPGVGSPGEFVIECTLGSFLQVDNSIIWNNPEQALNGSPLATYSCIEGGYAGTGNIDLDPVFVSGLYGDYYLSQIAAGQAIQSPCVDAGDPIATMITWTTRTDGVQDEDIVDMGYHYPCGAQLPAVQITVTPTNPPIQIPSEGGSFDYTIEGTNIDIVSHSVNVWCDVTLPDSTLFGPVLGPLSVTMEAGLTISRERIQTVPAGAPPGTYSYNAYAVVEADTSTDSFTFEKLGSDGSDWSTGWTNTGESFEAWLTNKDNEMIPVAFFMCQNYPNPFNPLTTISFGLPETGYVKLAVYDLLGRQVATLVNGQRMAGMHEVGFDASQLASGLYIYRIEAGDFSSVKKMILMK
jgi:hypothetical protein